MLPGLSNPVFERPVSNDRENRRSRTRVASPAHRPRVPKGRGKDTGQNSRNGVRFFRATARETWFTAVKVSSCLRVSGYKDCWSLM